MDYFWEGFTKQAVSSKWIANRLAKGYGKRTGLASKDSSFTDRLSKAMETHDKNTLKNVARNMQEEAPKGQHVVRQLEDSLPKRKRKFRKKRNRQSNKRKFKTNETEGLGVGLGEGFGGGLGKGDVAFGSGLLGFNLGAITNQLANDSQKKKSKKKSKKK